jgi:uncharacterized repeat protein (TIGR01451 family)
MTLVALVLWAAGASLSSATNTSSVPGPAGLLVPRLPGQAGPAGVVALVVYNTGVGDDGALLPDGTVDPHYRLVQSPDLAFPGPDARVAVSSGWPYGQWAEDGPDSKWISPRPDIAEGNSGGTYIYRTTVDLTGLDPTTAVIAGQWATDNDGLDILLNGNSTGNQNYPGLHFGTFAPFTTTNGFSAGTNTLDFIVHQSGAGTPTGLRVELRGTASLPCLDCDLPKPPVVSITSPADGEIFCPGTNVAVNVEATAQTGDITQVELYAGSALVGTQTGAPPYRFTLSALPVGDYGLTARAMNSQGQSAVSGPVNIAFTQLCPDRIGIVAVPGDPEIAPLKAVIYDMGLGAVVIDPAHLGSESIQGFKAWVWLASAGGTAVVTGSTLSLLQQAIAQGVSLYFIGEGLASTVASLDDPKAWAALLHIEPRPIGGGDGLVHLLREVPIHPVVQGMFGTGAVEDFPYELSIGGTATADTQVLGTWAGSDVLAAFPRDDGAAAGPARIVTQLFDAWSGTDAVSQEERKKLFQNAVSWLLRWTPCSIYSLSLEMDATNAVSVGSPFTYTLRVQQEGECEATGVLVTNQLPSQVQFLGAESTQGSFQEQGGLVTFRVGHLSSAAATILKIKVLALESGTVTNCAEAHGDGEQFVSANSGCHVVELTPGDDPRPALSLRPLSGNALQLQLKGAPGVPYTIESSGDLKQWAPWTNLVLTAVSNSWTQPASLGLRFYRALRMGSSFGK